jgi:M6 family metalloprotease-like protein
MRYPDLYDYGNRDNDNKKSNGMGKLCLMSSGSHLNPTPAPCAYLRLLSKFLEPQIIEKDKDKEYKLNTEFSSALVYYKDEIKSEGFIFELRGKIGFDDQIFDKKDKNNRLAI